MKLYYQLLIYFYSTRRAYYGIPPTKPEIRRLGIFVPIFALLWGDRATAKRKQGSKCIIMLNCRICSYPFALIFIKWHKLEKGFLSFKCLKWSTNKVPIHLFLHQLCPFSQILVFLVFKFFARDHTILRVAKSSKWGSIVVEIIQIFKFAINGIKIRV